MSDVKDPKIKLFGKTIELPETSVALAATSEAGGGGSSEDGSNKDPTCSSNSMVEDWIFAGEEGEQESDKSLLNPKQTDAKEDGQPQTFMPPGELKEPQINEGSKSLSNDSDSEAVKTSEEQTDTSNSHDKTLKKPDKILPCPRCNSMDTKFCYFNNYNASQPRHFCKKCQRYWTAGGTMRNVPVGAGRRKNKSQFHPLSLPEALHNGTDLNPNGTVLTFSSDASLPKSMASSLNIADKTNRNGPHRPEELQRISLSCGSKANENNESSVTATTCSKDEIPNSHPFPQFFPGAPWPYPWNPIPCIGPTSFPGAPWPYWASWAVPWVIPPTATTLQRPGPNSPTLGKHSRDDNVAKPEKCLWVPKTLRIDDPEEAAKSSIWETLGIKNERLDSVGGRGIFKVFGNQLKGDEKAHVPEPSAILQANPAALSRSNNFHESS